MDSTVYGPIFTPRKLEQSVSALLTDWIAEYLTEIQSQNAGIKLPPFKSMNVRPTGTRFVEDQLPACVVVSPGLADVPAKSGDGYLSAAFKIGVVVFGASTSEDQLRQNLGDYAMAVAAILMQQKYQDVTIEDRSWDALNFDVSDVDPESSRTYGAAITEFTLRVPGVLNIYKGPAFHDQVGDLPTVESPALSPSVIVGRIQ